MESPNKLTGFFGELRALRPCMIRLYIRDETDATGLLRTDCALLVVPRYHFRDTAGYFPGHRQVQEFIGTVGVGLRAEYAGDQKLGLGKLLPEHPHEWYRPAFPHGHRRPAEM